jgi:ubiquinone biosynthesis protein UbiJ
MQAIEKLKQERNKIRQEKRDLATASADVMAKWVTSNCLVNNIQNIFPDTNIFMRDDDLIDVILAAAVEAGCKVYILPSVLEELSKIKNSNQYNDKYYRAQWGLRRFANCQRKLGSKIEIIEGEQFPGAEHKYADNDFVSLVNYLCQQQQSSQIAQGKSLILTDDGILKSRILSRLNQLYPENNAWEDHVCADSLISFVPQMTEYFVQQIKLDRKISAIQTLIRQERKKKNQACPIESQFRYREVQVALHHETVINEPQKAELNGVKGSNRSTSETSAEPQPKPTSNTGHQLSPVAKTTIAAGFCGIAVLGGIALANMCRKD